MSGKLRKRKSPPKGGDVAVANPLQQAQVIEASSEEDGIEYKHGYAVVLFCRECGAVPVPSSRHGACCPNFHGRIVVRLSPQEHLERFKDTLPRARRLGRAWHVDGVGPVLRLHVPSIAPTASPAPGVILAVSGNRCRRIHAFRRTKP